MTISPLRPVAPHNMTTTQTNPAPAPTPAGQDQWSAPAPQVKTAFARINEAWFERGSEGTHSHFQKNPTEWQEYHATFRQARQTWDRTPADEMIAMYTDKPHAIIGDFGCGEGMIGQALAGQHTVHSFDHVAANPSVTACDIAHVPLADRALDVAIFSLALMGNNFTAYIDEAHRVLREGGTMHIIEMSRRFTDREGFLQGLSAKGFDIQSVTDMWKFTHITCSKSTASLQHHNPLVF